MGMVLARAKLGNTTSDIVATCDRHAALVSKGNFRDAAKVGREAPTGTLNTAELPKRKDAFGSAEEHRGLSEVDETYTEGKVRHAICSNSFRPKHARFVYTNE